ncbi:hypothetical protein ABB37_03592 [Leptomonas pyrrhocoris]|uniref:DNA polymerase delta subunit 3 n=1 Tax=Leptomonas pyrrhocoris TaxID=157538 RepID=A0A0M9G5A2_LEPPY|nr:hypothetical protein ABB37_03592 [Leptomonas pyrrhocoris]KPA82557.1 hypothetical protein ABB37_03592 [Leptomonas pyrrhocoris]|eukprot:XP_015660996.1 hypothetical protein ABB37_03592 [Leptomonas pyrrhocoris]
METQVISLLNCRPLLTTGEAACLLNVSEQAVQPVFAAVANANAGAYTLLGGTVEEAARGSTTITRVTMQAVKSTDNETYVYALMSLTYPAHVAASAVPIALRPSAIDTLRTYPVVSRAVMETRPSGAPCAAAPIAPAPPAVKAVTAVEPTAVKREAVNSSAGSLSAATTVSTPSLPIPAAEASPAPPVLRAIEVLAPTPVSAPETPLKQEPPQEAAAVVMEAPVASAQRKPTIFDKMKEAAATKRPREGDDAPAKAKKAATSKPKKTAKTENTTSLAKLARASKKKAGAAAPPSAPPNLSFLDEDDGDATHGTHNSEESSRHDAPFAVFEEAPVLDVVEVSASNDEVILCDDAPPLAFRPAEPLVPLSPTPGRKDAAAKKASAAVGEAGAAQCTLGFFFNPAVVEFQKSYVREVQTETKVEKGEYICIDVPCYKHTTTGEVISEEEYHRRTAQLVRGRDAPAETSPRTSAGAVSDAPPSPAAKSAARSPSDKESKAKSSSAPAKTLMSFFKPAA